MLMMLAAIFAMSFRFFPILFLLGALMEWSFLGSGISFPWEGAWGSLPDIARYVMLGVLGLLSLVEMVTVRIPEEKFPLFFNRIFLSPHIRVTAVWFLSGYALSQWFGPGAGIFAGGILGFFAGLFPLYIRDILGSKFSDFLALFAFLCPIFLPLLVLGIAALTFFVVLVVKKWMRQVKAWKEKQSQERQSWEKVVDTGFSASDQRSYVYAPTNRPVMVPDYTTGFPDESIPDAPGENKFNYDYFN